MSTYPDISVFKFSQKGKQSSVDQLQENLFKLLPADDEATLLDQVLQDPTSLAFDCPSVTAKESLFLILPISPLLTSTSGLHSTLSSPTYLLSGLHSTLSSPTYQLSGLHSTLLALRSSVVYAQLFLAPRISSVALIQTGFKRIDLLEVGSDPKQTRITPFFETILHAVSEVPGLNDVLQTAQQQGRGSRFDNVSCMLKELIQNAEKNTHKSKHGVRHQMVATSVLIYCGPMAYNLPNAIPSLRSVQRIIRDYKTFIEGDCRFDGSLRHLISFNAAKIVTIGEDATRIIGRVEYDNESNKLVSFVLPCDSNGLPKCDKYIVNTFESIERCNWVFS